jgi:hypothetical protein
MPHVVNFHLVFCERIPLIETAVDFSPYPKPQTVLHALVVSQSPVTRPSHELFPISQSYYVTQAVTETNRKKTPHARMRACVRACMRAAPCSFFVDFFASKKLHGDLSPGSNQAVILEKNLQLLDDFRIEIDFFIDAFHT